MTRSAHRLFRRRIIGLAHAADMNEKWLDMLKGMLFAYECADHDTPSRRARAMNRIVAEINRRVPGISNSVERFVHVMPDVSSMVEGYAAEADSIATEIEMKKG